jgi:hypothetical protein
MPLQAHAERITVVAVPETINSGQMIQVAAAVTDKFGTPIVVPTLYMEILDSKGRVYWKLSPIERNVSSFAKLIATNEMRSNTRYQVRISTNRKLSPMGYTFFKTRKRIIPLGILPILMVPGILIPENQLIPESAKRPIFVTYKTELDGRVCPICRPNEGLTFPINSPDIIKIGPPDLGGETHYGCRCHYDIEQAVNAAVAKIQRMLRSVNVVAPVIAVRKHKKLQNDTMLAWSKSR